MGRPTKNTVDYFPHDCNPNGNVIFILENKFGNNGYAAWYKIQEMLGTSKNHVIDCRNADTWEFLQAKTRLLDVELTKVIDTLVRLNVIDKELWEVDRVIWCQSFVDNLLPVYQNRRADLPSKPAVSTPQKAVSTKKTPHSIEKNSIEKNSIVLYGEFHNVVLSEEDYKKLVERFGIRASIKIDELSEYIKSQPQKAAKYKDHYATILSWDRLDKKRKEVNRVGTKQQQPKRFEEHQHIIAGTDEE